MKTIASICLPFWNLERLYKGALQTDIPYVLTAEIKGAKRITMLNKAAIKLGLSIGQSLADARAIFPQLQAKDADFEGDRIALEKLCHWFIRYTPFANFVIDGAKCAILLDISGCSHLWGSDKALMDDIFARLGKMGLSARIAIAPNIGSAWALSFYDRRAKTGLIVTENVAQNVKNLDIAALRLDEKTNDNLRSLGLKCIGDIAKIPPKSLARRFNAGVLRQLNRALGLEHEPLNPIREIVPDCVDVKILHAVLTSEGLEKYIEIAIEKICAHLNTKNIGAKRLLLSLFRVDGARFDILAMAANAHAKTELWQKLIKERLEIQKDNMDFGFGIDLITASADLCQALVAINCDLDPLEAAALKSADAVHRLAERLSARIGAGNVVRLNTRPRWSPENAQEKVAAIASNTPSDYPLHIAKRRPAFLFAKPEPIEAIAEIPDGPPRQIRFRRLSLKISHSTSAERIMGHEARDYYQVSAQSGQKLFLYRQGLYGESLPQWYVAGVG